MPVKDSNNIFIHPPSISRIWTRFPAVVSRSSWAETNLEKFGRESFAGLSGCELDVFCFLNFIFKAGRVARYTIVEVGDINFQVGLTNICWMMGVAVGAGIAGVVLVMTSLAVDLTFTSMI
jgi:hypothetical protein